MYIKLYRSEIQIHSVAVFPGIDAFSNIQKRLDEVLLTKPEEPEHPDPVQPPVVQPPVSKPSASEPAKSEAPAPRKTILKKPWAFGLKNLVPWLNGCLPNDAHPA